MRERVYGRWALGMALACVACGDDGGGDGSGDTDVATGEAGPTETAADASMDGSGSVGGDGTDDGADTEVDAESSGPGTDGCIDNASAGEHTFSCGGLTFDVSVPESCLSAPCGIIVDVHGRAVSGQIQDNNTNLRALGVERGYIVIQPNANPGVPDSAWSEGDDASIVDFVQRAITSYAADEARVHMTGFSQGGFMTWRMACNQEDLFASVAPASACGTDSEGSASCSFAGSDVPSRTVPILYAHGSADTVVDFGCSEPIRESVAAHFGLGGPETVAEGDGHRWTRQSGADGMVLEFIAHDYQAANRALGGHCIAGGTDPGDEPGQLLPISCQGPTAFDWGETVIDFFEAHPRQ